jgi:hypothetical protein
VSLTADDVLQMLGGPIELPLLRVSSSAARPASKQCRMINTIVYTSNYIALFVTASRVLRRYVHGLLLYI